MNILTISESISKAYRRQPINKGDMINFQKSLRVFFNTVSGDSIESNKETYLRDFLKGTFYYKNDINKISEVNMDWAVRLGEEQNSPVAIIIEDKRLQNKSGMITTTDLNRKAMQQLVYYYLKEKDQKKNIDVRHLIANNMYEFFIFDAVSFEQFFYQNKALVKDFREFENDEKDIKEVLKFYKYIGEKYIKDIQAEIPFTYFDLRSYKKSIEAEKPSDKDLNRLAPLYRVFSNYHLLKIPFSNERYGLNNHFYTELLHIMGLEEVEEAKGKKKKVIKRLPATRVNKASLMELTVPQVKKKLYKFDNRSLYGDTEEEQLFNISLQLCITWINRILFLKLLESQLLKYNKNKEDKFKLKQTIDNIKSQLKAGLWKKTQAYTEWVKACQELNKYNMPDFFYDKIPEKRKKKIRELQKIVDKKRAVIDETLSRTKYANAFEWRLEFPELLDEEGNFMGFDCIIGNPPYIQLQANKGKLANLYFDLGYDTFFKTGDIYCLFYEKAWQLLKKNAYLSYINPNTWLQSLTFNQFRLFMTSKFEWEKISITNKVFDQTVDTHITLFRKSDKQEDCHIYREEEKEFHFGHVLERRYIDHQGAFINIEATPQETKVARTILEECQPLSDYYKVYNGVKPFEKGKGIPPQTEQIAKEQPYVVEGAKPAEDWKPLLRGSLMNRYTNYWNEDYWIQYGPWLAAPREPKIFSADEKIIVRQTGDSIIATLLGKDIICRNNIHICIPMQNYDNQFVLGLLNSKLINFIYSYINPEKGEALAEIKKGHVEMLPIKMVSNESRISELVKQVLEKRMVDHNADISTELDDIDFNVYRLYGLTYDDILIVDPNTSITKEDYIHNVSNTL